MRKTRLVILPTKCLHQMGFLLLFLSCPVIGDWGRIRPDTATSHKAIQIDREGTCGLLRDHPGRLFSFTHKDGSNQCQLGEYEIHDSDIQLQKPVPEERSLFRRTDTRRVNIMQRKAENQERNARESMQRTVVMERRNDRRERQGERDVRRISHRRDVREVQGSAIRSRSLERDVRVRNEGMTRSRSLRRLDNEERRVSRQRSVERVEARSLNTRRETENERNARNANDRRMSSVRRMNDERRVEQQQRRMKREVQNDRRENERAIRSQRREEQRERSERSLPRSVERREFRRESTENSLRRSVQRENERKTRRTTSVERREIRRENERSTQRRTMENRRENDRSSRSTQRLSLTRREQEMQTQRRDTRRIERVENPQERRTANENRETRRARSLETRRNTFRLGDKTTRRSRSVNSQRVMETRRSPLGTVDELRNAREQRRLIPVTSKAVDEMRQIRTNLEPKQKTPNDYQTAEANGLLGELVDWIGLNNFKVGDWTTHCVVGAAAYFLTFRRVKIA